MIKKSWHVVWPKKAFVVIDVANIYLRFRGAKRYKIVIIGKN